jgi:hypothetical protein
VLGEEEHRRVLRSSPAVWDSNPSYQVLPVLLSSAFLPL